MIDVLVVLVVGKAMVAPNLCDVDYLINGQLHTVQYKCQENGTLLKESVGTHPSTTYSKP